MFKRFTLSVFSVVLMAFVIWSCTDTNVEPLTENLEPTKNTNARSKTNQQQSGPDPQCTIIGTDWDGYRMRPGAMRTFSVQAVNGATYTWFTTGGISILSGQGTNTITVRATFHGTLAVHMYKLVEGGNDIFCSNEGNIIVVPPPPPCNVAPAWNYDLWLQGNRGLNPVNLAKEGLYAFQIENVPCAERYRWDLPAGFTYLPGWPQDHSVIKVWTPNTNGSFKIKCYPQNADGTENGYKSIDINIPNGGTDIILPSN